MDALSFLCLNTGCRQAVWSRDVPRTQPSVAAFLAAYGGDIAGQAGWECTLIPIEGGGYFSISQGAEPMLVGAVAWSPAGAECLWPEVEVHYVQLYEAAIEILGHSIPDELISLPQPGPLPWGAIIKLPGLHADTSSAWVEKFAHQLGWTLLDLAPPVAVSPPATGS